MEDNVKKLDMRFYLWMRSHNVPPETVTLLKHYVHIGDGWFWFLVAGGLALARPFKEIVPIYAQAVATGFASVLFYEVIKNLIKRPRPSELHGITAEISPMDRYSFPSGHVMNNLAVGMALTYHFPKVGIVAIMMSVSWGILRVYFGVHYLSDIIGGALFAIPVAVLGGWMTQPLFEFLTKSLGAS